ncbi:MAG TPA: class I SAM-dependent methyltransferase [Methylomirabilota bacterium]|nr:class I SAM-dependent methyltransferase [Methylomirabilota bacterium]
MSVQQIEGKMLSGGEVSRPARPAEVLGGALLDGVQRGLDRTLSVWYGVVWDYIFERFEPYKALRREIMELVEASVQGSVTRRDVRLLEIGCGPGNFAFTMAEAGFSVVGLDPYAPLIELARERRRAKHLSNLAFQHADLANGNTFPDEAFDQVVNIHTLYVHPTPDRLIRQAYRVLKSGGHAVFVNHGSRIALRSAFRDVRRREGLGPAIRSLLWMLPNAIFEMVRRRVGPHYWNEREFARHLDEAGFTVLDVRRTFFNRASVLAWVRKDAGHP